MSDPADIPGAECDIIMKGGITSGVVYPEAILRLSERYRFRSIGGTSAGAIAAAITAAAEHNRTGGGFRTIAAIPSEISENLSTLFQPSPETRVFYTIAVEGLRDKRWLSIAGNILRHYGGRFALGVLGGCLAAVAVAALAGEIIAAALFVLLGLCAGLVAVAVAFVRDLRRVLPANDFGLCPGPTQQGSAQPGLIDWIAETIEVSAGRMQRGGRPPDRPLTFGDLWAGRDGKGNEGNRAVDLRLMTTNLSLRRPNTLPNLDGNHSFRADEFRRVMPGWIVDHLVRVSKAAGDGYYMLPTGGDLPVVVAVRMSLSFPFLLSAVPLHRAEFPYAKDRSKPPIQRMLFSDGGLSSNFPIHFFDAPLPRRPTFGVSLEEFDAREPDKRVRLPMSARRGVWLDATEIVTIQDFGISLLNAAKDWQDRLQTTLPGYRERVVSVYLKADEGGLNLTMPPELIEELSSFGGRAGGLLIGVPETSEDEDPFDFDDHRWRRYLVAFARFEETLESAARVWGSPQDPASFSAFVKAYMDDPRSYAESSMLWRASVYERLDTLMSLAASWNGQSLRQEPRYIPKPETDMRITPKP